MKNCFFLLSAACLFFVAACADVDKGLVDNMVAESKSAASMGKMTTAKTAVATVLTQLEGASETIKSNPAYLALLEKINGYTAKTEATAAEFADLSGKLNILLADYKAGKIKTEAAKQEFEIISAGFKGTNEIFDRLPVLAAETKSQFEQLTPAVLDEMGEK